MQFLRLIFILAIISFIVTQDTKANFIFNNKKYTDTGRVYISVKLKQNQHLELPYVDVSFEGKVLKFYNNSSKDTIITNFIAAKQTISITYTVYDTDKLNRSRFKHWVFIAKPNDTINLSINGRVFLDVSKVADSNLIADGNVPFYIDGGYLSKVVGQISKDQTWNYFKIDIDKKQASESKRIDSLWSHDKSNAGTFKAISKVHYFKKIFDWLWQADGKVYLPAKAYLTNHIIDILDLLNDPDLLLGQELLNVIDGYVRLSLLNQGKDWVSGVNVYNEGVKLNLGKFKMSYLTVCILRNPVKKGSGYFDNLKDYRARMISDTTLLNQVERSVASDLKQKQILTSKGLLTPDGQLPITIGGVLNKKKFTVIDFWASWCIPCRQQMPELDKVKKEMTSEPIQFISINLDDNTAKWLAATKKEQQYLDNNNYYLTDKDKAAFVKSLNIVSIPRYVVLKNNEIISADFYQPTEQSFKTELKKIIAL